MIDLKVSCASEADVGRTSIVLLIVVVAVVVVSVCGLRTPLATPEHGEPKLKHGV